MKLENYYKRTERDKIERFILTEKIDGANFNFRFSINQETLVTEIIFGSRNIDDIIRARLLNDRYEMLVNTNGDQFKQFSEFVVTKVLNKGIQLPKDYRNLIFFTEALIKHKINYFIDSDKLVVGFAVFDIEKNRYRSDWENLFSIIGIPIVPIIETSKTPDEIYKDIKNNEFIKTIKSQYDNQSRIEGYVIADYENHTFFKLKPNEFIEEKIELTKISTWDIFIEKYLTKNRMLSIINKMRNGELKFNHKNPVPAAIAYAIQDVFEEAAVNEIIKILKKELYPKFINKITSNIEIMELILKLKD
jgi:hypothetical protein